MRRRPVFAFMCWVPVAGLVMALFLAPTSNGVAADASLRVDPGSGSYGGQSVTWTGSVGVGGVQRIHLQRRGTPTSDWADVRDSTFTTEPDGSFSFRFPAPAMNGVYFRVVGQHGSTPAYLFKSRHQDADLTIAEAGPPASDVPLPRGFAVIGERYRIEADTKRGAAGDLKPILAGRGVALQYRAGGSGPWTDETRGVVGLDGLTRFGPYGPGAEKQAGGFYRVILAEWTEKGDRIGWFPSLPLYLRLVERPRPVTGLAATPKPDRVELAWSLPVDPDRARIVVARRSGALSPAPTAAQRSQIVATLPGTAVRYVDLDVNPGWTYKYAVYTVSPDGVYTAAEARIQTITPRGKVG